MPDQQHDVQERDDARTASFRREVGGEREPGRLRRVQAGADQQERQRRGDLADHAGQCVSPDSSISANGMIAKPPNCSSVPNQM